MESEQAGREMKLLSKDEKNNNNNSNSNSHDTDNIDDDVVKGPIASIQTGPFYTMRTLKTIILLMTMTLVGVAFSLLGSTFVDLQQYLNTDARVLSLVMPLSSAGLIVASLMAIFRLNKLSTELNMITSIICVSLVTSAWVAVSSIYWFLGLSVMHGYFVCLLLCEMQPYILKLWANHRLQKPLLLAIYALMTLGLAIGPFLVTPFLSNRGHNGHQSVFESSTSGQQNLSEVSVNTTQPEYTGQVKQAFITLGLPIMIPGILYCIVCFKSGALHWRKATKSNSHHDSGQGKQMKKLSKSDKTVLIVFTLMFYFCNAISEFIPLSFFTLYVSSLLGWVPPQSTLINSAFNGALCAGRLLGMPVSAYFKPRTILAINLGTVVSAASILLFSRVHSIFVWIGAATLGLGISLVFGTMLLWLSESIRVTDRLMAAIIISNALGGIVGPSVTGQLFVLVSPMSMTFMIFFASLCASALYILLRILEARRRRSRLVNQKEGVLKK